MFAALAGCMALSSCDEVDEYAYTPAEIPTNAQVFFSSELPSSVKLSSAENSFDVIVSRANDSSAATVALQVTASEEYFTAPSSVSFEAGSKTATLTIGYDAEKLGFDNAQTIKIVVPEEAATAYGISEYTFTAVIPAPWKSLGMATVVDDYITSFFSVSNVAWEVEIQENEMFPGYYRLVNPYCENYPYNDPGDWDATTDFYLEIHAENPNQVYIPIQESNLNWGYGNFIFGSLAAYYLNKGDEAQAADYYGKLEDGVISFPKSALLIAMAEYNDAGLYTANGNGAFKVLMPGVELADYSAEVAYAGKLYDAEDNLYILASATLGADVEEIKMAICAKGGEEALMSAIVAGEVENVVSLTASGTVNIAFDAESASGKYSIVGVVYGKGEVQDAVASTFTYTSLSGEAEETWTAMFVGNYYHCVKSYSQSGDGVWSDEKAMLHEGSTLYVSDADNSRYKIAPWIEGELIFTMDEEGNLVVDNADTGFENKGINIAATDFITAGVANIASVYAEGKFTFFLGWHDINDLAAGYYGFTQDEFVLTGNANSAPKKALRHDYPMYSFTKGCDFAVSPKTMKMVSAKAVF